MGSMTGVSAGASQRLTGTETETAVPQTNAATNARLEGNRLGRLFCLTLFTPIRPQWVTLMRVAFYAAKWLSFAQRHILQFNFIRFVRWTIVSPELPFNGAPQQRDKLKYHYLF